MKKSVILFTVIFLLVLNVFCWQEVFALVKNNNLKVNFLNVGQGDSEFIETPDLHYILIDGGPSSSVLQKLAEKMPFWDKTLDLVILTHPEKDHMQGLLDVLRIYKVNYILWNGVKKTAPEYDAWINVLQKQEKMGAKILIAKSGQKIIAGNLEIDTLFPFESLQGQELKNTSNDTCVVNRLVFGKASFLFTGDIDSSAENKIIKAKENIRSDVLKVAHHGSKYSTSNLFLQNANPEVAVIEVGKNTYGHPTPEVLQRLHDFNIKTLRTDQKGDITIISNGNNLIIN